MHEDVQLIVQDFSRFDFYSYSFEVVLLLLISGRDIWSPDLA